MINPLPKIDSLRLILPRNKVSINTEHPEFLRQLTTINEDGEILGSKVSNSYRLHSNPCSAHYLHATTIIDGIAQEVIKVGFSSKTLKEKYFDGINAENIHTIYDFIIAENVIDFSKENVIKDRALDKTRLINAKGNKYSTISQRPGTKTAPKTKHTFIVIVYVKGIVIKDISAFELISFL